MSLSKTRRAGAATAATAAAAAAPGATPMRRAAAALLLAAVAAAQTAPVQAQELRPVTVVRGLSGAWALAFLPDGRMLVTEKAGRLRIVAKDGTPGAPLAGLPAVDDTGQCGLLDVAVDPAFASNRTVYWTFAEPGPGGNSTALARARLGPDDRLSDVRTVFSQRPKVASRAHCGSRIAFLRDGSLVVGLGDRFSRKDDAQDPANEIGKTVRIERPASDAPQARVHSLGHRNIQGLAVDPATDTLWESEHGPQGGDEINVVEAGRNYGWPLVTLGRNYGTGTRIGDDGPKPGFEPPLKTWVPTSVAPSGLAFLTSDRYPGWKGSLFMGTLRGQALIRLALDGRRVVGEERLLESLGARIRDVRQGPDGWLYVVTDGGDGRVLRLER